MQFNLSSFLDFFISALSIFKDNATIGFICVTMLSLASITIIKIFIHDLHKNFSIQTVSRILGTANPQNVELVSRRLGEVGHTVESYEHPELKQNWEEYKTSIKIDVKLNRHISPIDPNSIFTLSSLGLMFRNWERVASLFVSVGLVLTFMGLVASLQQSGAAILSAGSEGDDIKSALSDLLVIVSAKFVLSITGLACSILINLAIDFRMRLNRRDVARLNFAFRSAILTVPSEVLLSDIRDSLMGIQSTGSGVSSC